MPPRRAAAIAGLDPTLVYAGTVILLTVLLPLAFTAAHYRLHGGDPLRLLLLWMTFWAGGVRLVLAGARQTLEPRFTARDIFGVQGDAVLPIVRELGLSSLAIGILGVAILFVPSGRLTAGAVTFLYYLLVGLRHLTDRERNTMRNVAMMTDLWVAAVLFVCLENRP